MTDIPQECLDALIEIEAESGATKLGITVDAAREAVRELWNNGELEVRNVGDNKHILCRRGGKATWLHAVPGIEDPLIVEHANSIAFVAEYDDGSKDYFRVHRSALESGDHVARIVAGEWQRAGRLKPGNIVRVYRDPKVGYIR